MLDSVAVRRETVIKVPIVILAALISVLTVGICQAKPVRLRTGAIEPPPKSQVQIQISTAISQPGYYLVQFKGPIEHGWRAGLEALGAKLSDYIPEDTLVTRMTAAQARKILKLSFVEWVGKLEPKHKVQPDLQKSGRSAVNVIIALFPEESSSAVKRLIRRCGGKVFKTRGSGPSERYIRALLPVRELEKIASLESVQWIEEWKPPKLVNNVAQDIMNVPEVRQRANLFGQGQIIAFADSGLDVGNEQTILPDFAGRIYKTYALGRENDWSDPTGHGTHVMGIALGSGVLSGSNPAEHSYEGSLAGVAPESQVIVQSMGDEQGYVHPPLALSELFQPPYDDGARVHSNSWGTASTGHYTVYSQQVDEFVWGHRDMVIVFAAGNDGRDANADGVTDLGAMYAPATAKNCIAVGGTESNRNTGRTGTYGEYWPSDFPAQCIRDDGISDDPGGVIGWSSRGPCTDGRIKPDICAPGTNIVSTRSRNDGTLGWGIYEPNPNYIYWGGTSMSTPMVAGAAAIVREQYIKNWSIEPSAALVKATLLNGAVDLYPGQYPQPCPQEMTERRPNNVEGWGRLDLSASITPLAPRVVAFVDEISGISTGQTRDYVYTVLSSSEPLAVTLVWTDPPGSPLAGVQLVNDLNLMVIDPESNIYLGNGRVDNLNNVESVDIQTPAPGAYTIRVTAFNVPSGPQPFALVISGALPGSYVAGTLRTASGLPIAGATVEVIGEGRSRTTTTAANGNYTVHIEPGTYTVTPSKPGWTFSPASREVVIVDAGVNDIDFTGSAPAGQIAGQVRESLGGMVNYILESPHPYYSNTDRYYTITAHPAATRIRVHFDEIQTDEGFDFIQIEDAFGIPVGEPFSGEVSNVWSEWVNGNVLKIHFMTDGYDNDFISPDYGFYVDGYETDLTVNQGLQGVTITAQPVGGPPRTTQTGPDGSYVFSDLEPVVYTVTASLPNWKFAPVSSVQSVSPGGQVNGVDFLAFPPSTVSGNVTWGTINPYSQIVQSDHPYAPNSYIVYEVHGPPGTTRMRVHFSTIRVEAGIDGVYVAGSDDIIVDEYSLWGIYTNVWSSWISGDTVKIILESDSAWEDFGFYSDKYEAVSDEVGVPSVTVVLDPGGQSASTDLNGAYTITQVAAGQYDVIPSRTYWSFFPSSSFVNVVSGVPTEGVDFFGISGPMPGIAYAKSLPDGDHVNLQGKVVTGGTDQFWNQYFYIEEDDRSSGIRIVPPSGVIRKGDVVNVAGTLATAGGERQIIAKSVELTGQSKPIPAPLGLKIYSLGGGALNEYTPGVAFGCGLNTIGLLVRIWGKCIAVQADSGPDNNWFLLDDGSIITQIPDPQVFPIYARVYCPQGLRLPLVGEYVIVTGISSCGLLGPGGYERTVRVRSQSDIRWPLGP